MGKHKKSKLEESQPTITDSSQSEAEYPKKPKKCKKRKCEEDKDECSDKAAEYEGETPSPNSKKAKKTKNIADADNKRPGIEIETSGLPAVEESQLPRKKKKNKKRKHSEKSDESSEIIQEPVVDTAEDNSGLINGNSKQLKKKKHKKKSKQDPVEDTSGGFVTRENLADSDREQCPKKKKKKRKKSQTNANDAECDGHKAETVVDTIKCEAINTDSVSKKKNKKSKRSDEKDTSERVSSINTAVHKSEESTVDQLGLATPIETPLEKKTTAPIGQWGTANFENEDRQNKFFRLLGGFKNKDKDSSSTIQNKFGSFGIKKPVTFNSSRPGGGSAMNREQQEAYKKTMEGEFDRALSSNLNRGIGLGFARPPEEGKKFHIDTNKSKSIKFDD